MTEFLFKVLIMKYILNDLEVFFHDSLMLFNVGSFKLLIFQGFFQILNLVDLFIQDHFCLDQIVVLAFDVLVQLFILGLPLFI